MFRALSRLCFCASASIAAYVAYAPSAALQADQFAPFHALACAVLGAVVAGLGAAFNG